MYIDLSRPEVMAYGDSTSTSAHVVVTDSQLKIKSYCFLPYYFGSAQLLRGSLDLNSLPGSYKTVIDASNPLPQDIINSDIVKSSSQNRNLLFQAVMRIHQQKNGPFHEHSPQLYSIATSVIGGWPKVNNGMWKMFVAEVLGKRVVVQASASDSLMH